MEKPNIFRVFLCKCFPLEQVQFFLTVWGLFFFFFYIYHAIGSGLQQLRLLSIWFTQCASLDGAGWHFSWTQIPFSGFLLFLLIFLHMFQEAISRINMYDSLGKNLALVCFQQWQQHTNIVDFSSFAMLTFVGHPFLNSAYSLEVHNITFLVGLHVCGRRTTPCFPKGLENIWQVPLLFPFVLVILKTTGRWQFHQVQIFRPVVSRY